MKDLRCSSGREAAAGYGGAGRECFGGEGADGGGVMVEVNGEEGRRWGKEREVGVGEFLIVNVGPTLSEIIEMRS